MTSFIENPTPRMSFSVKKRRAGAAPGALVAMVKMVSGSVT
jgi:hypothetical protein